MKPIWPLRHFGLKVLSLGLACLLWLVIAGEETVERSVRVPLELQQFPAGLELQGEPPALVDVRLRGSAGTLSRLLAGDVVALIDLRNARPGRRLFQLMPEQVRVPFGVQVVQLNPSTVTMVFEPSATRQVPVMPSVEGNPAAGFVTRSIDVTPTTVEVIGPESSVERVTEAITEPVWVTGARSKITEQVTVGFADPDLRLRTPRPATVTVDIVAGPPERVLQAQGVQVRGVGRGMAGEALPAVVDVVLRGSNEELGHVEAADAVPFIDVTGLGLGEYSLSVRVDVPPDGEVARIEPPVITVRISRVKD